MYSIAVQIVRLSLRSDMKLVKIEWLDANAADGWVSRARARTHPLAKCSTVGYVIKRNYRQITVAQSISTDKGDTCDAIISIPTSCIQSIKELE